MTQCDNCPFALTAPEPKAKRFSKPTPEQVTNYANLLGYSINGEQFCDFYESKGWLIGKTPMKSWQAAVRTWIKNSPRRSSSKASRRSTCQRCADTGEISGLPEHEFSALLASDKTADEIQAAITAARIQCPECKGVSVHAVR